MFDWIFIMSGVQWSSKQAWRQNEFKSLFILPSDFKDTVAAFPSTCQVNLKRTYEMSQKRNPHGAAGFENLFCENSFLPKWKTTWEQSNNGLRKAEPQIQESKHQSVLLTSFDSEL